MLKLISQLKDSRNCGQCTVAMITGKSLEEIESLYGHNGSSSIREAMKVLNELGFKTNEYIKIDNRKKIELPNLAMLRICDKNDRKRKGHFIAYYEGKVYCASRGVFESMDEYKEHLKRVNKRLSSYFAIEKI